MIALSRTASIDVRAKDTAQDRGLNVCREKRDAALSTVEEVGRLWQDKAMIEGIAVERLFVGEDCMLKELLKWSGEPCLICRWRRMSLEEFPWLRGTTSGVSQRKGVNKDNISAGSQMGHGKRRDQEMQGLLIIHGGGVTWLWDFARSQGIPPPGWHRAHLCEGT